MKSPFGNAGCHSLFEEVGLLRPSMLPIKDNATWVFPSLPSSANIYVNPSASLIASLTRRVLACWQPSRGRFWLQTSGGESSTSGRGRSLRATPRRSRTVGQRRQISAEVLQTASSPKRFCFRARREDQREHRTVEGVPLRWDVSSPRVQPPPHLRRRWRPQSRCCRFPFVKVDFAKSLLVLLTLKNTIATIIFSEWMSDP